MLPRALAAALLASVLPLLGACASSPAREAEPTAAVPADGAVDPATGMRIVGAAGASRSGDSSAPPAAWPGAPLPVRDQNPLVRGAYLPLPVVPLAADGWTVDADLQWSNTVNGGTAGDERFLVDAETAELALALHGRRGAWRLRAALPVIRRGPGVLDGFIDGWHEFFGLPEGFRPQRPEDAYALQYRRTGVTVDARRGTALGDLQLEAGRALVDRADAELVAWLGVEAPTGSRARLTGNGAVDGAAWLSGRRAFGSVTLSGQAGAALYGGDGALPLKAGAAFGSVALGWRALPALELVAQLDAHSALADGARTEFLDSAVLLTLGGRIRFESGAEFTAGVTEDIAVDRSPDVSFLFGFRFR